MAVLPWSHLLSFSGLSSPYCVTAPECSNPPDGAGQTHTDSLTYTRMYTHTRRRVLAGRFTHFPFFFFGGWHRSPWLVTYTEMMMPFLFCLSCTFLLVGNVVVKSCLAVTRLVACLQTFQNENISQQYSEFFRILSVWLGVRGTRRRTDASDSSYFAIALIWWGLGQQKQNTMWKSLWRR